MNWGRSNNPKRQRNSSSGISHAHTIQSRSESSWKRNGQLLSRAIRILKQSILYHGKTWLFELKLEITSLFITSIRLLQGHRGARTTILLELNDDHRNQKLTTVAGLVGNYANLHQLNMYIRRLETSNQIWILDSRYMGPFRTCSRYITIIIIKTAGMWRSRISVSKVAPSRRCPVRPVTVWSNIS